MTFRVWPKRNGFILCILILAAVFLFCVWDLDVIRHRSEVTDGAGSVTEYTETAAGGNAGGFFTASEDHLDSLCLYTGAVKDTDRLRLHLYHIENGTKPVQIAYEAAFLDAPDYNGTAVFKLDADTVPGDSYLCILKTPSGTVEVGLADPLLEGPAFDNALKNDEGLPGKRLAGSLHYSTALSAGIRLLITAATVLAAAFISFLIYRKCSLVEPVTIRKSIRPVLMPVILIASAVFLIEVWAFKRFDMRLPDLLVYTAGILLFVLLSGFVLYAYPSLDKEAQQKDIRAALPADWPVRLKGVLISICIAAVLLCCCNYQNGLVDLDHDIAERAMLIWFSVMLVIMALPAGKKDALPEGLPARFRAVPAGVWMIVSCVVCFLLYRRGKVTPDISVEYEEINRSARLMYAAVIAMGTAAVLTVTDLAGRFIQRSTARKGQHIKLCLWFAIPAAAFFASTLIFRNTRGWTVLLVLSAVLFGIRYILWQDRRAFYGYLSRGVILHFLLCVVYCLCHRYFLSYLYTRYSMHFHTVTVTAVYLSVVICAAVTAAIDRFCRIAGEKDAFPGIGKTVLFMWKELSVMGLACTYLLFTMSRTGIIAVLFMLFMVFVLVSAARRMAGRMILLYILMAIAALLIFPQAFTAQRVIPAVVGEPDLFKMEKYPEEVMRGRHVGSVYYISIERFATIFSNKLFNTEEAKFAFSMDPDRHIWWETEYDITPEQHEAVAAMVAETGIGTYAASLGDKDPSENTASESLPEESGTQLPAQEDTIEEYANGRLDYYRAYLKNMNLTGHDVMGVELPDGEISVHAHNTYLQVSFDHGVIAGLLFVLMLLAGAIRAGMYYNKAGRTDDCCACLPFAAIMAFMMTGMVEWVYHLCNPMTVLLLLSIIPLVYREDHEYKTV
ncbi:MAG: O-antigen ligase family protein [Lachnospiraceae bacterium]|nr:O-antigen ligase family protein [Lachnospiraceae bacterium]